VGWREKKLRDCFRGRQSKYHVTKLN